MSLRNHCRIPHLQRSSFRSDYFLRWADHSLQSKGSRSLTWCGNLANAPVQKSVGPADVAWKEPMAVFVTGVTGFLGRYLVGSLLEQGEDVVLLVRGEDQERAEQRARESLAWHDRGFDALVEGRAKVCAGELTRPGLGLSAEAREQVLERCDSFLHCGATVRFDLPLDQARAVNVEGTRGVLELASERQRRGRLRRVDHVSTAYVAGRRTDRVAEEDLDPKPGHRHSHEQTT